MNRKIGVLDSGVGGLSVMVGLQELLPNEDIIYFGDSKNCPYGNKGADEIFHLTMEILRFMEQNDVKLVAIACNTISTLIERFRSEFSFPIIDIISPTVEYIEKIKVDNLAIFGTEFTVKSNVYQRLLKDRNNEIRIIPEYSKTLATLVDCGDFKSDLVKDTIKTHMDNIICAGSTNNIVMACTHFPIVQDIFLEVAPELNYIDPGYEQAKAVKDYLHNNGLLNKKEKGTLNIYTSGEIDRYEKVVEKLNLQNIGGIYKKQL